MAIITTAPITVGGQAVAVQGGPWILSQASPGAEFNVIISANSGLWSGSQADLYTLAHASANYYDTGPGPKFYDGGNGIAQAWTYAQASGYGTRPNETRLTLCWKGTYNSTSFVATCRAALAKYPKAKLRVIWEQESDRATGPTVTAWQATLTSMWTDIQNNSDLKGKVEIWISLTGYNQYETPRAGKQLENFIPNSAVAAKVAGVSYDVYQYQGAYWTQTWSPKPELDNMLNRAKALGLALHIGEYGVTDLRPAGKPDSDSQRARRVQEAIDWCRANVGPVQGLSYFENYAGVDNTTTTGPIGLLKDHTSASPQFPLTWAAVKGMLA